MIYSNDALAILLLCSRSGLPNDPDQMPLTLREWNPLSQKLRAVSLRPEALLGLSEDEMISQIEIPAEEAYRLGLLLGRIGQLAIELERLESIGIRALVRADGDYPGRYRQRLKDSAPPVLFYAGEKDLLGQPGIAVVGSRNLDQAGEESAAFVGNACAHSGLVLYSGGARGLDTISINAALEGRGTGVGVLADSLEKTIRNKEKRSAIARGDLCMVTPYSPNADYSVGAAMGRNRLIYTLADYAIVVASDVGKGVTWAGATEALKAGWLPVFVLEHPTMADGNRKLLEKGGLPFPHPFPDDLSNLPDWLQASVSQFGAGPTQLGLFKFQ